MGKRGLEELLITNTIDQNPSIIHKLMQVSTFSYIEKKKDIDYADGEYPLRLYNKERKHYKNKKLLTEPRIDCWNADIILLYNDNGKNVCEIIEVETARADELLKHRKKNILKKINIVENAYNSFKLNEIFNGLDEVRFSLSINAAHLTENERYKVARAISRTITQEKDKKYNGDVELYKIYMLKDNIWGYCKNDDDKEFLLDYNLTKGKNLWKKPLKRVMLQLYYTLQDKEKANALYDGYYFKK